MTGLLERFVKTTTIVGVHQAYHGGKVTKLYWLGLILTAYGMTLYSVNQLLGEYLSEGIAVDSIVHKNETIKLPNPAICLRLYARDVWKAILSPNDWFSTTSVRNMIDYFENNQILDIPRFIERNITDNTMNRNESKVFMYLTTIMFLSLSTAEMRIASALTESNYENVNYSLTWNQSMEHRIYANYSWMIPEPVVMLRNYVAWKNTNFTALRYAVALAWLKQTELKVAPSSYTMSLYYLHDMQPELTWFGSVPFVVSEQSYFNTFFSICFRLPKNDTYFTYDKENSWFLFQYFFVTFPAIDVLLSNDRAITKPNLIKTTASFDWYFRLVVTFVQRHKALNLKRKPCLTKTTNFDCQMHCRSKVIEQQCDCIPSSFAWSTEMQLSASKHYCGLGTSNETTLFIRDYISCYAHLQNSYSLVQECIRKTCFQDCITNTYTFEENEQFIMEEGFGYRLSELTYTEYTDKLLMSQSDFIANLGGVAGLWNGACAMSYIHAITSFLQWILDRCMKRLTNKKVSSWFEANFVHSPVASTTRTLESDFVESTGVTGVLYAYKGTVWEKVFWSTLVAASLILTVRDVAKQVEAFVTDNSISIVSIKHGSVSLPNPTICLKPDLRNLYLHDAMFRLSETEYVRQLLPQYDNQMDLPNWLLENAQNETFVTKHATFIALSTNVFFVSSFVDSMLSSSYVTTFKDGLNDSMRQLYIA